MSVQRAKRTDRLKRIEKMNRSLKDQKQQQADQKPIRLKFRQSLKANCTESCFIQTDTNFIEDIEKIAKPQQNVLAALLDKTNKKRLTDEECDQIDFKARLHYKANIVNKNTDNLWNQVEQKHRCDCGCKRTKGEPLSLLANIKEMSILGSGVVLLFMFKKTFSFILLSAVIIYAIFAIVTNLMGDSAKTVTQCQDLYCEYRTKASSENKLEPGVFTVIQWWMGVAFCFVWIFILRFIKYFGKSEDQSIDESLKSSSDYAVMISNLPFGEYEEQDLVTYFDLLHEKALKMAPEIANQNQSDTSSNANDQAMTNQSQKRMNKFNIKNVQIIYNMEFSRALLQKILSLAIMLKGFYKLHKQTNEMRINQRDVNEYKNIKQEICQTYELMSDLRKKFFNDQSFRKQISTAVAIVEFDRPSDKDFFLRHFGNEKIGILKEIQEKIKSYFKKPSKTIMFRGKVLKITRAPEPSDLIYKNCEKKSSISRFFLIWVMTFAIIIISFGIITVLMFVQDYVSKARANESDADHIDDTTITILNIIISIGLQIVNTFLWSALFYILDIEYNYTLTQKIISQMNKVLIATCINIIVLPIISNYVIRNNVYGSKGLAGMVFDYQISILGVGLVTKLVDPGIFVKRLLLFVRPIRNIIIRFMCDKLGDVNIAKGVPEINTYYEGGYFNIAESYVYIMAASYQAAFFCELQPSLLVLVSLVVICFYWVNKYKVLRTCKIPQITQILIFQTALSQAALIPIVYGAGSIAITYIETTYNPNLPFSYTPAFISIGIGFFGFFNPKDWLNKVVKFFMDKILDKQRDRKNVEEASSANNFLEKSKGKPELSDQIPEPQIMTRLDNYFRNANSLPLVGFEHVLSSGQQVIFPESSLKELQNFCGKFVENDDYRRKVQKKIKQVIVTKMFGKQQGETSGKGRGRESIVLGNLENFLNTNGGNQKEGRQSKIVLPRLDRRISVGRV